MQLSKPIAVIVLIATLVPFAHVAFFMVTFVTAMLGGLEGERGVNWIRLLFVFHALCILWIWSLIAFYVVFLFKSAAVPNDQKALWALVLFFANVLAMPLFWYLYIWQRSPKSPAAQQPDL